jgi:DNA repair exonuclease SbcCD ATPase subunit
LDKEVDSVIAELKPKCDKAKMVEMALSELPIKYTQSFINSVIEDANYFIDKLLTYPLVIDKYATTEECDFSFPVVIEHDVKSKDISYCSDGQKAIINLAFNLALIIELKYNDYPIYVDEIDRALDTTHSHRLTKLLTSLKDTGVVSQMMVVNHHQSMIDGVNGDVVILNGDNITLPSTYNEYVTIIN